MSVHVQTIELGKPPWKILSPTKMTTSVFEKISHEYLYSRRELHFCFAIDDFTVETKCRPTYDGFIPRLIFHPKNLFITPSINVILREFSLCEHFHGLLSPWLHSKRGTGMTYCVIWCLFFSINSLLVAATCSVTNWPETIKLYQSTT